MNVLWPKKKKSNCDKNSISVNFTVFSKQRRFNRIFLNFKTFSLRHLKLPRVQQELLKIGYQCKYRNIIEEVLVVSLRGKSKTNKLKNRHHVNSQYRYILQYTQNKKLFMNSTNNLRKSLWKLVKNNVSLLTIFIYCIYGNSTNIRSF